MRAENPSASWKLYVLSKNALPGALEAAAAGGCDWNICPYSCQEDHNILWWRGGGTTRCCGWGWRWHPRRARGLIRQLGGRTSCALKHDVTHIWRSEEHTSELQSLRHLVCRL